MSVKLVWADEIPEVADMDSAKMEALYTACALVLGDPDGSREVKPGIDFTHRDGQLKAFHDFYRQYFQGQLIPGPFSYVSYMIWYQREQTRTQTKQPT